MSSQKQSQHWPPPVVQQEDPLGNQHKQRIHAKSMTPCHLSWTSFFGSTRTTRYTMRGLSTSLNQCGVLGGMITTSPALIRRLAPPWIELPVVLGPLRMRTISLSGGTVLGSTSDPPVTSVPAPSMTW